MKIYHGEKNGVKTTTAVMVGTGETAQQIVSRRLDISDSLVDVYGVLGEEPIEDTLERAMAWNKLRMADTYRATVKCHPDDEYDEAVGEAEARNKVKANWKVATDKAIKRWQVAMMEKVIKANPETFHDALVKVLEKAGYGCECDCDECTCQRECKCDQTEASE